MVRDDPEFLGAARTVGQWIWVHMLITLRRKAIMADPRDPRLIAVRRGATLSDADHHLAALSAAGCAGHVLPDDTCWSVFSC
jgi:hypothetical protein